ncbi:Abi-alpha family protein [Streptococcus uberis]
MDPNQFNIPISAKTGDALLEKPSKSLGRAFSDVTEGIFHLIFDGLRRKNIVKDIELEAFEKATRKKILETPEEFRTNENINIAIKVLDDSKYQLNSDEMIELFSSLFSACFDSRKTVKPFYSSLLKEMSPEEARLLKYLFEYNFLFEFQVSSNNNFFSNPNLYRNYWPKKYFTCKVTESFSQYRNYEGIKREGDSKMEDMYIPTVHYQEDRSVEESFLFLLTNSIIENNQIYHDHQFIPSIKKYIHETDEDIIRLQKENEVTTPKVNFDIEQKVYTLSTIGYELKKILINGTNTIIDVD